MMNTIPLHPNDRFLRAFIHKIIPSLMATQLKHISSICLGLLAGIPHKSISSISRALLIPKDQSNLNRSLTESDWGCEIPLIDLKKVQLMQQYKQTCFKSGGYLIIDDSLLKKSGTSMELIHAHFNHCSFTMENYLGRKFKLELQSISINEKRISGCHNTSKNYFFFCIFYPIIFIFHPPGFES